MMMAISGAERVFRIIDSQDEVDNGEITLVNVVKDKEDNLIETTERTGILLGKSL